MGAIASQITSLTIVYSTIHSGADQRKHQSSASLAFVREIHRSPVNSPHKWPVTRKVFPFDDVIMVTQIMFQWGRVIGVLCEFKSWRSIFFLCLYFLSLFSRIYIHYYNSTLLSIYQFNWHSSHLFIPERWSPMATTKFFNNSNISPKLLFSCIIMSYRMASNCALR